MNTFQYIMVGLAAFLAVPVLINKLYIWTGGRAKVEPPPVEGESLVDVIDCWERLQKLCDKHGLKEAKEEVHKVFPLFAKLKDMP
jgi:hypothetical protein